MKISKHKIRLAHIDEPETPVQSGLAVSPAQMAELMEHGIPISSQTAGATYDEGYYKQDFQPPMENCRGVDINDAWEATQASKQAFRDADSAAIKKRKNQPKTE